MTSKIIVAIVAIVAVFAGCGGDSPVGPTTDPNTPIPPVETPRTNAPTSIYNTVITFRYNFPTFRCLRGAVPDSATRATEVSFWLGGTYERHVTRAHVQFEDGDTETSEIPPGELSYNYSYSGDNRARAWIRFRDSDSPSADHEYELTFDGSSRGRFTNTYRDDTEDPDETCTRYTVRGTFEIRST